MCERILMLRGREIKVKKAHNSLLDIPRFRDNLNSTETAVSGNEEYRTHLKVLKADFFNQSVEIQKAWDNPSGSKKMATEFSMKDAIKYIPEFKGVAEELDSFLFQCDSFAKLLSDEDSDEPLIQVVLTKLKGPAAASFKRVFASTWDALRVNLIKEFGERISLEEVFEKVETLAQNQSESYLSYRNRALKLKDLIEELTGLCKEDSYAIKNLRIHFIAGLNNPELKTVARSKKHITFESLLDELEEECKEAETIRKIEGRLNRSIGTQNGGNITLGSNGTSASGGQPNSSFTQSSHSYRNNSNNFNSSIGNSSRNFNTNNNNNNDSIKTHQSNFNNNNDNDHNGSQGNTVPDYHRYQQPNFSNSNYNKFSNTNLNHFRNSTPRKPWQQNFNYRTEQDNQFQKN